MDIVDITIGIPIGIIGSIVGGLVFILPTPEGRKLKEIWNCIGNIGLKLFLPLDEFKKKDIFEKIVADGKGSTEILNVGRTIRWLIQRKKEYLLKD